MKSNILLKLIIIVVIATISLSGCTNPENDLSKLESIVLKLNWKHGTSFLGFYIAQSQGFYAQEGLDVTIEELSDPSLAKNIPLQVLNGEFEFGVAASDLARAQAEGLELSAVGNIIKLAPAAFFARKELGINTPADFAGHSVVVKSLSWQEILEEFLDYADLSLEDVEVFDGGYDMTPFFEGDVDIWAGFITEEVVLARLKGIEVTTLPLYDYNAGGSSVTMFTTQHLLQTNSDLAVRFVRASIRGWQFAIDNPTLAISQMLAAYPELSEDFDFYLASFEATIPLIIPSGADLGDIDCDDWNAHEQFNNLKSTDNFCTREIYLDAVNKNN